MINTIFIKNAIVRTRIFDELKKLKSLWRASEFRLRSIGFTVMLNAITARGVAAFGHFVHQPTGPERRHLPNAEVISSKLREELGLAAKIL